MHARRRLLARVGGRVMFPVLAVSMGASALVAGLGDSAFLTGRSVPVRADSAPTSSPLVAITRGLRVASAAIPGAPGSRTAEPGSRAELDLATKHARIDEWVARLTTSGRRDFQRSLDRMDDYSPMITAKLDARRMPRELIYLALIESNFDPAAKSPVSAVGMWQFMSATAREFGLRVGRGTDERKNPAKATDAALTYLSSLHDRFGSWYLAAAAYNSGQGTVSKALRKVTGRSTGTDADFFRILSVLPKETQGYVPKLIAVARVGSSPERYGFN